MAKTHLLSLFVYFGQALYAPCRALTHDIADALIVTGVLAHAPTHALIRALIRALDTF